MAKLKPRLEKSLKMKDNDMKNDINFEDAIKALEDAISRLESGEATLDESLELFNESVRLVKLCNQKLDSAEKKVRILLEKEDGTVDDAPFDPDDEA